MLDVSNIREKAVRYIGLSKKTEFEVRKKIKGSGADETITDSIIASLKEAGYIDDKDYIMSYIRQCEKGLNYSVFEIKQRLIQKGIDKQLLVAYIEDLINSDYEVSVINKLMNSKLKRVDEIKAKAYLYRRRI